MKALPLSYMDRTFMERLNGAGWHVATEPVARNSTGYDGRPACCGNNNCMPICPIAAQYSGDVHVRKAQAAGARVVVDAIASRIETDADGRVTGVVYRGRLDGADRRIACRQLVLAANGIEIPKLMLMSASESRPAGIGNASGQVGRNLMDHPGTGVTFLADRRLWPGRGPQEMTSVLNLRDGDFRSRYAAKKLHLSNSVQVGWVTNKMIDAGELGGDTMARIRDRAARHLAIHSFHEQLPEPENRVVPSRRETDETGLPKPEIRYSIGAYVRESAKRTREAYARIAELMGGTEVSFNDAFFNNHHLMGTTVMGTSPKDSVVDRACRCHDHPNLWIASSSVNASAATVNPTLTIAALSLRVADAVARALRS
jgi:choline dehydrogenase-like flavoprotein